MANPRLAPYGRAAQQILQGRNLWAGLQGRLVRGENVAQAYHFVASGNAELGFVAYSQILQSGAENGSLWLPPQSEYEAIEQQMVLLTERKYARDFWQFMRTPEVRALIRAQGYALTETQENSP